MAQATEIIANRYQLLEVLGEGGMGTVYLSKDRLSGATVAVKRVLLNNEFGDLMDLRLALAQEFQTLASLRHPHIIAVLDYGFDSQQRPYFVMPLLDHALPLAEAGWQTNDLGKVNLLVQMLQALAYLHRRGIIHRDLKPANVLVTPKDGVKLLDFGLAIQEEHSTDITGTLLYMAPEILLQDGATHLSDLYAVGIMAYEIFAGQHPYEAEDPGQIIQNVLMSNPDLLAIPDELDLSEPIYGAPDLRDIIERLMSKDPSDRYSDAYAVIREFSAVAGQATPEESSAIRESYLQSAAFVGRDRELLTLRVALKDALKGKGSAWLVGGESGVGKSRLLEELRIQALVEGALVLRGQEVAEGALPYQLWREPVRRLLLGADLSDLRASILKEIVPDISRVLGREIGDIPPLSGSEAQERLMLEIANLFRDQASPIVLILEDLHWASESLEALKQVSRMVGNQALLILASYSSEERPDLPKVLPSLQVLHLERLSDAAIREITRSMLGTAGTAAHLVELLMRETEGNIFFLVETIRSLAEEAGSLDNIAQMTLPEHVFAGGVRQVVERRLRHVPEQYHPLLRIAAAVGRQIDVAILQSLVEHSADSGLHSTNVDDWLTACANATVLSNWEGNWRFAHDKLREVLLDNLALAERQAQYRQVAETIERMFPNDNAQALVLANHWRDAGETPKETYYAYLAGEVALNGGNFETAVLAFERVLDGLAPAETSKRTSTLKLIGDAYESLSKYEEALSYYDSSLNLAREADDAFGIAAALNGKGNIAHRRGDFGAAQASYEEGLVYARMSKHEPQIAQLLKGLGTVAALRGNLDEAQTKFEESLTMNRALNYEREIANCLNNLGIVMRHKGKIEAAQHYYEGALEIRRDISDKRGIASSLNNLGSLANHSRDLDAAVQYYSESAAIFREIGEVRGIGIILNNLGGIYIEKEDFFAAIECFTESIPIAREIGDQRSLAQGQENLGRVAMLQQNYNSALEYFEDSIKITRAMGDKRATANTLNQMGIGLTELGRSMQAQVSLNSAYDLFVEIGDKLGMIEVLHNLGAMALRKQDLAEAEKRFKAALTEAAKLASESSILYALGGYAELFLQQGNLAQAAQIHGYIHRHELEGGYRLRYLKEIYQMAEAAIPPEQFQAERANGAETHREDWFETLGIVF